MELSIGASADPTASFVTSPAAPKVGANVGFNASASKGAGSSRITTYIWDFGDASPVVTTADPITNHQFTVAGSFTVTLKVVDDSGHFNVTSRSLTIAPATP